MCFTNSDATYWILGSTFGFWGLKSLFSCRPCRQSIERNRSDPCRTTLIKNDIHPEISQEEVDLIYSRHPYTGSDLQKTNPSEKKYPLPCPGTKRRCIIHSWVLVSCSSYQQIWILLGVGRRIENDCGKCDSRFSDMIWFMM